MKAFCIRAYRYAQRQLRAMLHSNRYYSWYVVARNRSQAWLAQMNRHYTNESVCIDSAKRKTIIFICNGMIEHGGLADRLRGIVSTYALCKDMEVDFRLLFTSPFPLTDYLLPNLYDWRTDPAEVHFNFQYADRVALEISEESEWQAERQYRYLRRCIERAAKPEVHVCTNAHFSYLRDFHTLFHELFRPAERLEAELAQCQVALGTNYISLSARFIGGLGDFTDTLSCGELPAEHKQRLINSCIEAIKHLHEEHPDQHILVCSDSEHFLRVASSLSYTYTYAGEIHHLDVQATQAGYASYEKTFVDFLLISRATEVCRLDGRWLHSSGFPRMASLIGNRPFRSIPINL